MQTYIAMAPKRLWSENKLHVWQKRAYISNPRIPQKAAPMVFQTWSIASTILNDDETAGVEGVTRYGLLYPMISESIYSIQYPLFHRVPTGF